MAESLASSSSSSSYPEGKKKKCFAPKRDGKGTFSSLFPFSLRPPLPSPFSNSLFDVSPVCRKPLCLPVSSFWCVAFSQGKKSPARNRNPISGFFFFLLNVTGALIAFGGGETVSCKFGDSRRNLFHIFFFVSLSLSQEVPLLLPPMRGR